MGEASGEDEPTMEKNSLSEASCEWGSLSTESEPDAIYRAAADLAQFGRLCLG